MTNQLIEDQKTVASIDTEYQAAVEKNDAATMDRILADDFVLIGSRGKVFFEGRPAGGSAQRSRRLRISDRQRASCPRMGRHRRDHRAALGEGNRGWRAIPLQTVVQRYVRPHRRRMEIRAGAGRGEACAGVRWAYAFAFFAASRDIGFTRRREDAKQSRVDR